MIRYGPDSLSERWARLTPAERAAAADALAREMPIRFRRPAVMRAVPRRTPPKRQDRR